MLTLAIKGIANEKRRCVQCAGEPAPDLPARTEPAPITTPDLMVPVQSLAHALPQDWKWASTGEREPGEEG
jgi:hypothetical protein